jgi:hypothetical protein
MMKSKRLARIGRTNVAWVSSLLLVLTLGVTTPAFAQDDAGAAAVAVPVAEPAPAPEPAAEPAPAPEPAAEVAPAPAPAADATAPTALSNLSAELMNILIPVFVSLIGALAAFLLNWVRKKFKLNVSDHQIAAWAGIAEKAANRGGEWARNKAKEATEDKKVPGPEVLEIATNWAVEMGVHFNLPEMGREKLIGLIESHLHAKREDPDHPLPLEIEDKPAEA